MLPRLCLNRRPDDPCLLEEAKGDIGGPIGQVVHARSSEPENTRGYYRIFSRKSSVCEIPTVESRKSMAREMAAKFVRYIVCSIKSERPIGTRFADRMTTFLFMAMADVSNFKDTDIPVAGESWVEAFCSKFNEQIQSAKEAAPSQTQLCQLEYYEEQFIIAKQQAGTRYRKHLSLIYDQECKRRQEKEMQEHVDTPSDSDSGD